MTVLALLLIEHAVTLHVELAQRGLLVGQGVVQVGLHQLLLNLLLPLLELTLAHPNELFGEVGIPLPHEHIQGTGPPQINHNSSSALHDWRHQHLISEIPARFHQPGQQPIKLAVGVLLHEALELVDVLDPLHDHVRVGVAPAQPLHEQLPVVLVQQQA